MSLFTELKRRKVFRVALVYAATAFVILQAADIMLPRMGIPDWGVGLVVALAVLGFPIALVLAWALELTPEGIKRAESVAAGEGEGAAPALLGERTVLIAALLVAVGVGLGAGWFLKLAPSMHTDARVSLGDSAAPDLQRSIAVLPFVNMSGEAEQEYFSDGISEEILNLLAKQPELKVAGRSSAFQFKGQHQDLRRVGEALGVETVLEGSVRKAGERLRITAQLISTADGFHLWSETYDRELTDVFAIQDDIARSIAEALQVTLLGAVAERARPTENLEAYQLYLQGRHLILQRGAANLETAAGRLQHAVELDPDFAAAWAELGVALALLPAYGLDVDQAESYRRATEAAARALALAPDHAMALATRGYVAFSSGRFEEGLAYYPRALELEPENETIWLWYGVHATSVGHIEAALERVGRAYALSPSTGINAGWTGALHSIRGNEARARRFIDEGIALGWAYSHVSLALQRRRAGDVAGAQQAMRRFLRSMGEPEDGLDAIIAGDSDPALRLQAEADLAAHLAHRRHFSTYYGAVFMRRGDVIVEYFDSMSNNRIAEWLHLYWPEVRSILNDPALQAYLRRIGMVDFWRAHGWPEFCRPLAEDAFVCDAPEDADGGGTS